MSTQVRDDAIGKGSDQTEEPAEANKWNQGSTKVNGGDTPSIRLAAAVGIPKGTVDALCLEMADLPK